MPCTRGRDKRAENSDPKLPALGDRGEHRAEMLHPIRLFSFVVRARSHHPEQRIENQPMIARPTPAFLYEERFEISPLFVLHQSPNHPALSVKRSFESCFRVTGIRCTDNLSTRPNLRWI